MSSHSEHRHNAIPVTNNFVACKHGHVVAAVLSRAQFCTLLFLFLDEAAAKQPDRPETPAEAKLIGKEFGDFLNVKVRPVIICKATVKYFHNEARSFSYRSLKVNEFSLILAKISFYTYVFSASQNTVLPQPKSFLVSETHWAVAVL